MAWPGFASQPQDAPVTAVPLPVVHVATYRDGGSLLLPGQSTAVVREMGNVAISFEGGQDVVGKPSLRLELQVLDAYGVLLVDRTEISLATHVAPEDWRRQRHEGGLWNSCEVPSG